MTAESQPAPDQGESVDSGPTEIGAEPAEADPEVTEVVPLLEPRDGLPPVVESAEALERATQALAGGTGPIAVDAERASGYRYGHRAYLVQLRRAGSGTVLIDPILCPDLSGDRRGPGRHRDRAARRVTGPALPVRAGLPAPAAVRHRAGRAAARLPAGRRWARWSRPCSACTWRRGTRPPTGPPGRCRWNGCGTPRWTSRCWSSCGTRWPRCWSSRASWTGPSRSSPRCCRPPRPRRGPIHGAGRPASTGSAAAAAWPWSGRCGRQRDQIAQEPDLSPGRVLPDAAIVEAARSLPTSNGTLTEIGGFTGRVRAQAPAGVARGHPAGPRPARERAARHRR